MCEQTLAYIYYFMTTSADDKDWQQKMDHVEQCRVLM